MNTHDAAHIDIRNPKIVRQWAEELGTTPKIVKIAVKRVGASPSLVQNYLACAPDRGRPELYSQRRN